MQRTVRSVVIALIATAGCAAIASAAPAKHKAGPLQALEQHFRKADADLKRGDKRAAAAELRAAAQVFREELATASGSAAKLLRPVPQELEKAASRIGSIDRAALHRTFARAYQALAAYHTRMASGAWAKRQRRKVGSYLEAAGTELRHAARWTGPSVERAYISVAEHALGLADRLSKGSKVSGAEVEKALKGLGERIGALGRRLPARRE